MTPDDFRVIALGFDDAEEGSHMGQVDFRVDGRIFATLAARDLGFGNLMLTPELQRELIASDPEVFLPIAGGWGRRGATHIRLAAANRDQLFRALAVAWKLRVEKNQAGKSKPAAPRKRSGRKKRES